ncbi:MAG: hypothetical protein H6R01_939 [Burkholderiaceae bacterium]|nr:hypothetical protein [Burkholderiaceae bacterium]
MALVACKECGKEVSTEAKSCPNCGAKPPKKPSMIVRVGGGIILASLAAAFFMGAGGSKEASKPAISVPVSEQQKKEFAEKEKKDKAEKAASENRFQLVVAAAGALKSAMREPDSTQWDSIMSNDSGSVICFQYRGKNGFGGVNVEHAVYAGGKFSQKKASWNKHCAGKTMNDMTYARRAL